MRELEARHLADLRFSEVTRGVRALSSIYVARRGTALAGGAALSGAGKRAAFALFYGPIHHLLVREIVTAIPGARTGIATLVDLGCGTGAAGAAWAAACERAPDVVAVDKHPWALQEAARTYRDFGLRARTTRADIAEFKLPRSKTPLALVAAFAFNELPDRARDVMLPRLLERASRGERILVVEPLAGFTAPWWRRWREAFELAGGRADEWRFRIGLPALVEKLDRAAGLNHREMTGRSLWIGPLHQGSHVHRLDAPQG